MNYTTHYNLNLPEGTDIVNPLTQDNPNYSAIDAVMFANRQATIGSATELESGGVHAITRSNTDSNYIRFTATANWNYGDTMTVDGVSVSVFLPDGTLPQDNAYVVNSEVLILISGTRVTFLTGGGSAANESYSVNSDGVMTWEQLLNSLYNTIPDKSKLTEHSVLVLHTPTNYQYYQFVSMTNDYAQLTYSRTGSEAGAQIVNWFFVVRSSGSAHKAGSAIDFVDRSSQVPSLGNTVTIYL